MKMKNTLFILFSAIFLCPVFSTAQIENVVVETYYISDTFDSTDTTSLRILEPGSKTYRIFIDLAPGSKIKRIYGDANHVLRISSSSYFFNNLDRHTNFGYQINKNWFDNEPLSALDSWLTIGKATRTDYGILKTLDTNGSFVGGANNNGGTAGIPGGLLINSDPPGLLPLTSVDGLLPDTATILPQWFDYGFKNLSGDDTTVFGSDSITAEFISYDAFLQNNSGVIGVTSENLVLVAQVTTLGELSFQLNLEVEEPDGAFTKIVKYVSQLAAGESNTDTLQISPYLTYPTICGCRNTAYLEYSPAYACDNNDSCKTLIVFGCMDINACNYDPGANYSLPSLCCYPGHCNNRDLSVVCPSLSNERFSFYPNPVEDFLTVTFKDIEEGEAMYFIYNSYGLLVKEENIGYISGTFTQQVEVSNFPTGLYMIKLFTGNTSYSRTLIKK